MPNVSAVNHPLAGTEQVYLPPGATADPDANMPPADRGLVARFGDRVLVKEVYENWNGRRGLTMAYVLVPSTGQHVLLSAREMGLPGPGDPAPGHPARPGRDPQPRSRSGNGRGAPGSAAARRGSRQPG